jgi:opacity protein-like surface antigen
MGDRIGEGVERLIRPIAIGCLASALALGFSATASAEDEPEVGFYIQYNAGVTHVPNQNLTAADASGTKFLPGPGGTTIDTGQRFSGRYEPEVGFHVGGAIGTRFLHDFRAEVEYIYRENHVENIGIQGERTKGNGHVGVMTAMVNAYYDLNLLEFPVVPYVGIGIGYARFDINAKNYTLTPERAKVSDSDSAFAYSFMAGGSYAVNDMIDLVLGYRYLRLTDMEVNASLTNPKVTPTERRARRLDTEYDAHEGTVGLRLNF